MEHRLVQLLCSLQKITSNNKCIYTTFVPKNITPKPPPPLEAVSGSLLPAGEQANTGLQRRQLPWLHRSRVNTQFWCQRNASCKIIK